MMWFVLGRERELDVIRAAQRGLASGPRVVLVTGAAGIGKTTLVSAAAAEFEAQGALVLGGASCRRSPPPGCRCGCS